MIDSQDISAELADTVARHASSGEPLYIVGGDSKRHLVGRDCEAAPLNVAQHCGVVDYEPSELVITVRGGTPVAAVEEVLAGEGQMLASEPPCLGGAATVGGTLASNMSGPARPWAGSLRDSVLGVALIDGRGEQLRFGGRVMKNVAGYDVARLQAGALGTLGILTEISLKVMPRPQCTRSLSVAANAAEAIETMNRVAVRPSPLSGAYWLDGQLNLRLSGASQAVQRFIDDWNTETVEETAQWEALREYALPFFANNDPLWRMSVGAAASLRDADEEALIDWGGALRWLRGERDSQSLQQHARESGGHAALYRGGNRREEVRPPLDGVQRKLHQRLKHSFDPAGIFNPGRLYSWL